MFPRQRIYEAVYLLGTSIAPPFDCQKQIEIAEKVRRRRVAMALRERATIRCARAVLLRR